MKSIVAAVRDLCKVKKNTGQMVMAMEMEQGTVEGLPSILPPTIWANIGKRLPCRSGVVNFRSVCRTWRSSLPLPSRFPLKVPPPPDFRFGFGDKVSFFVSDVTFYAVNQMIVAFQELDPGGVFSPWAFWPRRQHERRPVLPARALSRLSFVSNTYHLQTARTTIFGTRRGICNEVLKIAIISPGNPNYASACDVTVVAHLAGKKLAAFRLSTMDWEWETDFCSLAFEDIVNYRGQLLAVDKWGRVYAMDPDSLHMSKVASALPNYDGESENRRELYLMAAPDDLYLLIDDSEKVDWKVYKLRLGVRKWLEIEDEEDEFGDLVVVIGMQCSFPVDRDLLVARNWTMMMMMHRMPRFCAWPDFDFVPIHVNVEDESPMCYRHSYRSRDTLSTFF